jgi:hypothetical protein
MSLVGRLNDEQLRTRRIIATAALTAVAITFLLLSNASASASATSAVPEGSIQAAAEQVRPDPGEPGPEQMSASEMPRPVRPQEE